MASRHVDLTNACKKTMILTHWLNEGNCLGRVIIRAALGTGRRYKVLITMQVRFRHQPAVANHLKQYRTRTTRCCRVLPQPVPAILSS